MRHVPLREQHSRQYDIPIGRGDTLKMYQALFLAFFFQTLELAM
jgi:hypothetical protein